MNAFDLAAGRAWALAEDDLLTVMTIAARGGEGPEAVALRLGRPLEKTRTATRQGDVAIVPLEGPMFRRANLFTEISGATSTEQFAQDFQAAIDNPGIMGVVLDLSTPGGEAAGVNEIANAIFAARGLKPIVAYVGDMAASGGYWIASAADRIVMDATAIVGSIGVVSRYVKRPDSPGVRVTEIVSSQSPNKRLDPETDAGRLDIQRQVDAIAQVFVDTVARNRGVDPAVVIDRFGAGGVQVGAEAVARGMADAIGSLQSVVTELSSPAGPPGPAAIQRRVQMETKPIVIEALAADVVATLYPEAATALRAEGRAAAEALTAAAVGEARTAGAVAERTRIIDIQAAALPGFEQVATDAIASGASAPDFALAQARAQRGKGADYLAALKGDETALAGLKPAALPASTGAVDPNLPLDDRCKAEWDKSPELRAEFAGTFSRYLAYAKAQDQGLVRRLSTRPAA